jgi:CheY-like chemotaxis protein/anti-sigma regulatory factor (Ser/Thr protein kinase)
MIDLSKIRAGKSPLIISNVALKAVCQASLALFQPEIQQKRLHVALEYDDAVQTLPADEHRLRQILFNLLSNAVKFTPESGTIGLQVVGDPAGHAVHITVWDTGIGIATENIAYLFQPFVQLDGRLSKAYGGTGLGLALVYRIVEMHGGCVTVTSSPGMGSCFTIALPWSTDIPPTCGMFVQEDGNVDTGAILNWPQTLHRPGMLIAENNESQLAHLSQHFLAAGYQVVVARNGSEAIAHAHEMRPDILVLSVHMPDVDGLEITRRIRADNTLRATFIIALTSLAVPGEQERYLAAGVNAYFKHPVHLATMIAIMEVHLHHVRRIPVEVEGR